MARKATGQVVEVKGKRGVSFALRFRAYGKRQYVTLGTRTDGWTRAKAEEELQNVLADVRRGIWQPPERRPEPEETRPEPSFHEFASEWIAVRQPELAAKTVAGYRWALELHLLPEFARMRLSEITVQDGRPLQVREGPRGPPRPRADQQDAEGAGDDPGDRAGVRPPGPEPPQPGQRPPPPT